MRSKIQQSIPIGWQSIFVDDICHVMKGQGLSKKDIDPFGKNKCLLYGELFTTYDEVIETVKSRTNSNVGTPSFNGDILIPGSTTTVARDLAVASALNEDGVLLGGDINILRKKDDFYDSKFLAYYLTHYKKDEIGKLGQGTTIVHLYGSNIKNIELIIPKDIKEQQKIAEILGTVDEDIAKTQEVIEVTKKLKRGLMQQLFTCGIRGRAPEIVPLGKVAKVQGGYSFKSSDFSDTGVPVIRISNIKDGFIKLDDIKYYPKEITKRLEAFSLKKDDVVVAMSGATTGKIGIVKETDLPLLLNQRVGRFSLSGDIDGKYLYNIVISEFYQKRIWDFAIGGAQPNVSGPQLESIEIPLLDMSEQKEIAEILSAVDEKISVNKKLKEKLTLLKKGLMQDLLSGKVKVNL
jgi:restriction endonuclease S subunit